MSFLSLCPKNNIQGRIISQRFWVFRYLIANQLKSTNVNNIEAYINDLVQTKSTKWELVRKNYEQQRSIKEETNKPENFKFQERSKLILKELKNLDQSPLPVDIKALDAYQIDNLVINSLDEGNKTDLYILIDQLLNYRKLPSERVTKEIMMYLCCVCDENNLEKFINLCASDFREFYNSNLQFRHFQSLLLWKRGNATQSMRNYRELFIECSESTMRDSLIEMLNLIVDETLGSKSEGVLVSLTEFAQFLGKNFNDYNILTKIWMKSFKSVWYSDNCLARDLFESDEKVRDIVGQRASFLSYLYLKEHNMEAVHRLIELFLKCNMKNECRNVLMVLFNYHCEYLEFRVKTVN